ncbi:hypothetical protein TNCV_518041 [Trichonephila clavipes]|nr:hypothetical protein TNCV_518041 [Trichonephila clavipes]
MVSVLCVEINILVESCRVFLPFSPHSEVPAREARASYKGSENTHPHAVRVDQDFVEESCPDSFMAGSLPRFVPYRASVGQLKWQLSPYTYRYLYIIRR